MIRCIRSLLGLVVLAAPAAALGTPPTILKVPGDSDTIQGAVDMAGPDTIIKVSKAVYAEAVSIQNKTNLTLMGKGKPTINPATDDASITITGGDGVVIQGFKLEHALKGVEIVDCTNTTVRKCRFVDMDEDGVHASDSSFLLIEKNVVEDMGQFGLGIGDVPGVTDCVVSKNKVTGTGSHGILLGGDNNVAEKNKVKETGGHGIEVRSTVVSSNNVFRQNTLKDIGAVGMIANGNDNLFEMNKLNVSGEDGGRITDTSTGNTFLNNKISKPGERGINVLGDGNTVTGCKVTKAVLDGFGVDGDGNELEANKSSKAGADGFHVVGTGNTFTSNKAKGSGDLDLEDENGPGFNTYVDNVFPDNNLGL